MVFVFYHLLESFNHEYVVDNRVCVLTLYIQKSQGTSAIMEKMFIV